MDEKPTSFSIKNWSQDDRPREKLLQKGKSVLTDAELIAILIGSGSRNESAVSLSKRILASVEHSLSSLGKLSVEQLMQFKGIGEAKAVSIAAALELGRRRKNGHSEEKRKITSSRIAFEMMQPIVGELPHEEFYIMYLNNSHKVLTISQLSKGGITGTVVDMRLVLRKALEVMATALILVHNHPSGNPNPSNADKDLTRRIKSAAESIDIKVLDHLIITEKTYYSFSDNHVI